MQSGRSERQHRPVAGCATPTGFAGHASATASLKLTFHPDHSEGAITGALSIAWSGAGAGRHSGDASTPKSGSIANRASNHRKSCEMAENQTFPRTQRIGIFVFEGFEPIDVWGFAEAFAIARFLGTF